MRFDRYHKYAIIIFCILFSACSTTQKTAEKNSAMRWPDFLRDWATHYEINDSRHLVVIDQIDTLYQLIEDSTSDNKFLCDKLCLIKNTISDIIVNDTTVVFPLMMRATARNINGKIFNNPWLLERHCPCSGGDYFVIDAQWNVMNQNDYDMMYTSILGAILASTDAFSRFDDYQRGHKRFRYYDTNRI